MPRPGVLRQPHRDCPRPAAPPQAGAQKTERRHSHESLRPHTALSQLPKRGSSPASATDERIHNLWPIHTTQPCSATTWVEESEPGARGKTPGTEGAPSHRVSPWMGNVQHGPTPREGIRGFAGLLGAGKWGVTSSWSRVCLWGKFRTRRTWGFHPSVNVRSAPGF